MTAVPPPDETAHLDNLLMAEVTSLNNQLGRYVLRFLDADAGRAASPTVEEERALADRVAAVAEGLLARTARRDQRGDPMPLLGPATAETADG